MKIQVLTALFCFRVLSSYLSSIEQCSSDCISLEEGLIMWKYIN